MLRHGVVFSIMTVLALLIGCLPKKPPAKAAAKTEENAQPYPGNIPLVFINNTQATVSAFMIGEGKDYYGGKTRGHFIANGDAVADYKKYGTPIPPGGQAKYMIAAGTYNLTVKGRTKADGYEDDSLLSSYVVDVSGPTEIVVYLKDKPSETPTAGFTRHVVLDYSTKLHEDGLVKSANDKKARDADYAACKKANAPSFEAPASGKTKIDGSWTCVMTGGVTGTNYVKLVQLADGKITATITGADRNTTWEGIVKGDEVRFHYGTVDNSGGILKVDPGGKAMKGTGNVFFADTGRCTAYGLTCTK